MHKSAVTEAKPITLIKSFQWIYGNASCQLTVTTGTNATMHLTVQKLPERRPSLAAVRQSPRVSYFGDSFVHLHCNSRDYRVLDGLKKMHRPGFIKPIADWQILGAQ